MCVRDAVEGQSAGRHVQIHSYSCRIRRWDRYASVHIIVPGSESIRRTVQTPGFFTASKPTVIPSFPADFFICHCYISLTSSPFSLPVTASSQNLSTQNLLKALKSVWMIRIRLLLLNMCCFSIILRQREFNMCCV